MGRRKGKRVRHFTLLRDTKKRLRFIEFLQRTYNTKELFSVHNTPTKTSFFQKRATFFSRPTETDGRVFFRETTERASFLSESERERD